jgi:hypothetical protein
MRAIADRFGTESFDGKVLPSQSREMLRTRKPYTGATLGSPERPGTSAIPSRPDGAESVLTRASRHAI